MSSNSPFSRRRVRADLLAGLPAACMFLGAVLGVLVRLGQGFGAAVATGGIGIGAGLLIGLLLRVAFRPAPPDES